MDRRYWEKIASSYNEEIFDVLQNDKKAIIRTAIREFASGSKTATDIGCAVGKWLPILSPAFKRVVAIDISAKNLAIAEKTYPQLRNVKFLRVDMSASKPRLPECDFAICINAILTGSLKKRTTFFQNLGRCLKKGGHIILTVPSLESSFLTLIIGDRWKIDREILASKLSGKEAIRKWNNIIQGNSYIDNVPTKHYLREELQLLLALAGFKMIKCRKIEYDWATEFVNPPSWLKEPRPWDWFCVAKKL